jgi:hypothetical protein
MSDVMFGKVIAMVLRDAENRRTDAGYGGRWDDGGASRLQDQVSFFQYGLARTLPPEWEEYRKQADNEADPEYKEYLRLHQKFGDK